MKLLVAAEPEPGETFRTVPGELVRFPTSICGSLDCDCDQMMFGLASGQRTPAVMVRDIDLDVATYTELLGEALARAGHDVDRARLNEYARDHIETASFLPCEEALLLNHFPPIDPDACAGPTPQTQGGL